MKAIFYRWLFYYLIGNDGRSIKCRARLIWYRKSQLDQRESDSVFICFQSIIEMKDWNSDW